MSKISWQQFLELIPTLAGNEIDFEERGAKYHGQVDRITVRQDDHGTADVITSWQERQERGQTNWLPDGIGCRFNQHFFQQGDDFELAENGELTVEYLYGRTVITPNKEPEHLFGRLHS